MSKFPARSALFVLSAAAAAVLATASPASAASGGIIVNASDSTGNITIQGSTGSYATLFPGQSSTQQFADTDAFMLDDGCGGFVNGQWMYDSGQWLPMVDNYNTTVSVYC